MRHQIHSWSYKASPLPYNYLGSLPDLRQTKTFSLFRHGLLHVMGGVYTGLFGFLRSSEFTCNGPFDLQSHLTKSDISFQPNIFHPKSFVVVIKKSKTDPFRETSRLTIAKSNSSVCAVTALKDYLLQTHTRGANQPLFQFSDGRNLTRASLNNNLKALLHICGLDSSHYTSHSFRIGAATTAGAAGLPDWLIKVLGRWKSDAYQIYIQTPKETLLKVPQDLASCHTH